MQPQSGADENRIEEIIQCADAACRSEMLAGPVAESESRLPVCRYLHRKRLGEDASGKGGDPRRFRLGEKEDAGAADAVIYQGTMGFE